MNAVKINNWSCTTKESPYIAPELRKLKLQGEVIGHDKIKDGTFVRTSNILSVDGRKITTRNTVYILGKIDPAYRKLLRKIKPTWDWRNPIETKQEK